MCHVGRRLDVACLSRASRYWIPNQAMHQSTDCIRVSALCYWIPNQAMHQSTDCIRVSALCYWIPNQAMHQSTDCIRVSALCSLFPRLVLRQTHATTQLHAIHWASCMQHNAMGYIRTAQTEHILAIRWPCARSVILQYNPCQTKA